MLTPERARKGLTVYFAVLIIGSALLEYLIITHGGLSGPWGWLVLVLMYTPGISSIVARLVGREGFGDVSFRWGGKAGTKASLYAWLLPVAIGFVAYGVAWAGGLAGFAAPNGGTLASIDNPVARFLASIPLALTVGTVMSCISAFGEELGWRGYMVPRMVDAGWSHPFLASALIWAFWHVPLILWGGYAVGPYPAVSALLFILSITPVGLLLARWRMTSGSVWPCVIAHGSWNVIIQSVFDRFTTGDRSALWIGESGIFTVAALWLTYGIISRLDRPAGQPLADVRRA